MNLRSTMQVNCAAIFATGLVVFAPFGLAQEAEAPFNRQAVEKSLESPPEPSADVSELISKLGDESWSARETASSKLQRMGVAVLPALKRAYHATQDAEVRLRVELVFQGIVTPKMLRDSIQISLLGIRISQSPASDPPTPIEVSEVIEGGAADKAGIQPNDVILGLNGRDIDYSEGSNAFRFPLWACGKGAVVTLKISRDGKEIELKAKLDGGNASELLQSDLEAFEQWYWKQWFETHVKTDKSSKRSSNH